MGGENMKMNDKYIQGKSENSLFVTGAENSEKFDCDAMKFFRKKKKDEHDNLKLEIERRNIDLT